MRVAKAKAHLRGRQPELNPRHEAHLTELLGSQAEPQLFVSDINAAYVFLEHELGFNVVFTHGDPPFYGQVRRDHVSLNLRYVCDPCSMVQFEKMTNCSRINHYRECQGALQRIHRS
jgi:hypothetical protein